MAAKTLNTSAAAYYMWKWVSIEKKGVVVQSETKFAQEEECRAEGEDSEPFGQNFNGARLVVTAYDSKDRETIPKEVKGTFKLSEKFGVQASYFGGKPRIDIRQLTPEGYPTKKGLFLTPQRWVRLLGLTHQVNKAMQEIKEGKQVDARFHVSGPVFITMSSPWWTVNLREWYMKDGEELPSPKGVVLKAGDWAKLLSLEGNVLECLPELNTVVPCIMDEDHQNQEGALNCSECTPFNLLHD